VLWRCLTCGTRYAVGLPRCPHCRSEDYEEDGVPKITSSGVSFPEPQGPAAAPEPEVAPEPPAPAAPAEPEAAPAPAPKPAPAPARAPKKAPDA
jgi:uncharacterized OB-fold protein